ncbi:MAG: hypothetical protein CM1200mP29_07730 [Verrucomicrobiota bacterium]|nr:MAG: hypothetical protein CM1200mP29_07730 [Verrucomicrobiota bacterium]
MGDQFHLIEQVVVVLHQILGPIRRRDDPEDGERGAEVAGFNSGVSRRDVLATDSPNAFRWPSESGNTRMVREFFVGC